MPTTEYTDNAAKLTKECGPGIEKLVDQVRRVYASKGYELKEVSILDWDRTVILILKKDGHLFKVPIVQIYYDRLDDGALKFHGAVDIRDTPWYRDGLLPWLVLNKG